MRYLQELLDDRWTRLGGIVFLLMLALVVFNFFLELPSRSPVFGLLALSLVPVLFAVELVIFAIAILKS
jgi:hypothetical protein